MCKACCFYIVLCHSAELCLCVYCDVHAVSMLCMLYHNHQSHDKTIKYDHV